MTPGRPSRLGRVRRLVPERRADGTSRAPARTPARTFRKRGAQPKVVALGGGQGLSASLAALRRITGDLTAVVTVADDGGSSGRLRDELGVLPPGDLRKALAALCGDDEWGQTWARVVQHRFASEGDLHGHAVGNLLIVALWEQLGDHVRALEWVGRLLGAHGRVLPMSAVPLELQALVLGHDPEFPTEVTTVRGQATVALTRGEVQSVHLVPSDPPAVPEAVEAVLDADWVILGPGSWFSSVIPHLLVPQLLDALTETKARRVLSLNLAPQPGETAGFSPQRHLEVLARHAPKLAFDVVLADEAAVPDRDSLIDAAERLGGTVELAPVASAQSVSQAGGSGGSSPRHDPELLAAAYDRIFRMHGRIGPWR
ncbi:uridine diphosphate-N-acetylglucosamine-binding protein YvcK [Streptomyces sp. NPDC048639]|uniref:gluconeogenesis factor YvcK family protein n=1 Tax=Streptomyces sp. NPDC048639 TaxID=3365581 RepID=UPI00372160AB